jgi:nucleoside-diphosphate-sugar epimerase
MKVLVLCGTGAMGVHTVELLIKKGITTFITSRRYHKSDENLQYIQGDAHNISFLESILESNEWDAVVDFMVYNTQSFKTRIDLLLNNTKQYVFLSSARVYANSEQPVTETSPRLLDAVQDIDYLNSDEYALAKARQENILHDSGYNNWTIIRPYITYSENRLQLGVFEKEGWLYRALKGRTIVFSEDICKKFTTLTYGLDVSKRIVAIIGKTDALGEQFNITTGKSVKWIDVLDIYLSILEKHLGFRPKVLLQDLDNFLELKTGKYQIVYDRLYDRTFDNSKISKFVGTNDFTDFVAGLNLCLEAFLKRPDFNNINWYSEAVKDKQTREHTALKEIAGIKQKIKYLTVRYLSKEL